MADVNERVMQMVEAEIKKNPNATTTELKEKAKKLDKSVEKLSARQFNARYPLQVKRRLSPPRRRRSGGRRRSAEPNRGAIRQVLVRFAQDLAGSGPGEVVALIADVDKVVEKVVKASASKK